MNRIFFYDDPTKALLVTDVAKYIISFSHEFCLNCFDILDDYDFTDLNFEEIVNSDARIDYSERSVSGGHGIDIRPK
jgi:hypothetical protein